MTHWSWRTSVWLCSTHPYNADNADVADVAGVAAVRAQIWHLWSYAILTIVWRLMGSLFVARFAVGSFDQCRVLCWAKRLLQSALPQQVSTLEGGDAVKGIRTRRPRIYCRVQDNCEKTVCMHYHELLEEHYSRAALYHARAVCTATQRHTSSRIVPHTGLVVVGK